MAIDEHIGALEAKLKEVEVNTKEVEKRLYDMLQDCLFKLQEEAVSCVKCHLLTTMMINMHQL